MIGKKVRVFWPVDNSWYVGVVLQYDASTGEHLLKYDDEDTEWVKIGESNTCAPPPAPGSRGRGDEGGPNLDGPPLSPGATPSTAVDHNSSRKGETASRPTGRAHDLDDNGAQERAWPLDRSHPSQPLDTGHPSYGYGPTQQGMFPGAPYGMHPGPGYHVPPGAFQGGPYGYPPMMNLPPTMMGSGHDIRPAKSPSDQRASPSSLSGSGAKRKQGPKAVSWVKITQN